MQVFQYGAGVMRFSRAQGNCIFGLGDLPQATFQTNVRTSSNHIPMTLSERGEAGRRDVMVDSHDGRGSVEEMQLYHLLMLNCV